MSGRLEGRVAFITGAARGQGRAHAVRMANEGADIIAVDIAGPLPPCVPYDPATPEDLAETVRLVEETGRRILRIGGRHPRQRGAAMPPSRQGVAEFGRLDIIVANAGVSAPQAWDEITPEDFRDVMDINVTGTWNTVMAGAQKIIDGGRGGSIILISSAAGIKMQPFMIHYTASKHAVTGMARAFAAELGKHSIRVNSVHPGPVITDMGTGDMVAALGKAMETNPQLCQHDDAVPADLGCGAGGHRRRGVLAGRRRVEIHHRERDLGRSGLNALLRRAELWPRRRPGRRRPCRTSRGPARHRSGRTGSGAPAPGRAAAVVAIASAGTYWSKSAICTSSGQRNLLAAACGSHRRRPPARRHSRSRCATSGPPSTGSSRRRRPAPARRVHRPGPPAASAWAPLPWRRRAGS